MTPEQERLCNDNLRLAGFFTMKYRHCGIEWEELNSLAQLGLVKAAIAHDPSRGKFSTCAGLYIQHEIGVALRNGKAKKRTAVLVSLHEPLGKQSEDCCLMDLLPDPGEPFYEEAEYQELQKQMLENRKLLTDRERLALALYYGLDGNEPRSQQCVATALRCSQAHANRLILSARKKLRCSLEEAA